MVTITRLIQYKNATPLTRVKFSPIKSPQSFVFKASRPGLSAKERMRERRAQAREQGFCGVCTYRRPRPGWKICDGCRK